MLLMTICTDNDSSLRKGKALDNTMQDACDITLDARTEKDGQQRKCLKKQVPLRMRSYSRTFRGKDLGAGASRHTSYQMQRRLQMLPAVDNSSGV